MPFATVNKHTANDVKYADRPIVDGRPIHQWVTATHPWSMITRVLVRRGRNVRWPRRGTAN